MGADIVIFIINYHHYLSPWLELLNSLLNIVHVNQVQLLKKKKEKVYLFMIQCGQFKIQQ